MRRPRRLVLSVAALGLVAAASGCSYFNPVQTHDFYQAADGTNANLEQDSGALAAGVRNAIVVVDDSGSAELRGSAVNYLEDDITLDLEGSVDGASAFTASVAVRAGGSVELGPGEGEQAVDIAALDVAPGDIMQLTVTLDGESTEISLPVTDTTLAYYQDSSADPNGEGAASDGGGASDGGEG